MFEFMTVERIFGDTIDLVLDRKVPANDERGLVPAYVFKMVKHGEDEAIGSIDFRAGYNDNIYYGGHIGYGVDEAHRGHGYAAIAVGLLQPLAVFHDICPVIITCDPANLASKRTLENAGLLLKEVVHLPEDNPMYLEGEREKCIFEWHWK